MIKATRTQWIKFAVVLALYLIFLVWLRSWLGLVVVPFIFDAYITKKIPWTWWRKSKNRHVVTVMGWVDAIVFALVAVYFVNLYFFRCTCRWRNTHCRFLIVNHTLSIHNGIING